MTGTVLQATVREVTFAFYLHGDLLGPTCIPGEWASFETLLKHVLDARIQKKGPVTLSRFWTMGFSSEDLREQILGARPKSEPLSLPAAPRKSGRYGLRRKNASGQPYLSITSPGGSTAVDDYVDIPGTVVLRFLCHRALGILVTFSMSIIGKI